MRPPSRPRRCTESLLRSARFKSCEPPGLEAPLFPPHGFRCCCRITHDSTTLASTPSPLRPSSRQAPRWLRLLYAVVCYLADDRIRKEINFGPASVHVALVHEVSSHRRIGQKPVAPGSRVHVCCTTITTSTKAHVSSPMEKRKENREEAIGVLKVTAYGRNQVHSSPLNCSTY